jgi:hypothetical protein
MPASPCSKFIFFYFYFFKLKKVWMECEEILFEALPRSRTTLIFVRLKDEMAVVMFPRYKERARSFYSNLDCNILVLFLLSWIVRSNFSTSVNI